SAAASLMAATQRMIDGQTADVAFERRDQVGLPECLGMARDKTGALLGCACALGAELAGAEQPLIDGLRAFGEHVGLAFQLVDDLLGIWGDTRRTGKQIGADLRVRKKSLPVVAALNTPGADELRALYLGPDPLDEHAVRRVADLVEQAGGRRWAQEEAARQTAAAERSLTAAEMPEGVRGEFLEIAGLLLGRQL
ncbi:polyprenyl synthetase family protein, partial [Streptomonospora algeriensis]